jgi:hypothetical protein
MFASGLPAFVTLPDTADNAGPDSPQPAAENTASRDMTDNVRRVRRLRDIAGFLQ